MVDYLVLNETRKRGRTVSRGFKKYQFYDKENKPDSMKCSFKTNKILTAVKETDHTITTSEGRIIHKKLASKPSKFQTSRKTDEQKAINRCRRCRKFSSGELCETHQRLQTTRQDPNNNIEDNKPSTSHTLPTMPMKKKKQGYNRVVVYDSSSRDSNSVKNDADKDSSEEEVNPEDTDLRAEIGREIENLRNQTPMLTPPIGCSTEIATDVTQPDQSGTPIRGQSAATTTTVEHETTGKPRLKPKTKTENHQTKIDLEPRRSERIRTAQRVVKLGGVEYF